MQKQKFNNNKINFSTEEEIFETVLDKDHVFRKLNKVISWNKIAGNLRKLYRKNGKIGIDVRKGLKCLVMQFWENYSDREMEKALKENFAIKWFCEFGIGEDTPDHSYFGKLRKRIGQKELLKIFEKINLELSSKGITGNVFEVIDASAIVTKTQLWAERDRAIADGEKKLNNKNVTRYAADKDARWGVKGKNKKWFGYKRHVSVDCKSGIILKVSATPANEPDFKEAKHIAGSGKVIFMDKGYDYPEVDEELKKKGSISCAIRKKNNPRKDWQKDSWRTKIRMPFEGVFSKMERRSRYRGKAKVTMQCILESISYNLKKALTILAISEVGLDLN